MTGTSTQRALLTQRDNWCDARLESPDFRRRCLIVSTREGSGRGAPWNRLKRGCRRRSDRIGTRPSGARCGFPSGVVHCCHPMDGDHVLKGLRC